MARMVPTGMSTVSGHCALSGTQPPSVSATRSSVAVQMDRVVGHGEIGHADAQALAERTGITSMPGNTRAFQVQRLKSVISATLGSAPPGVMSNAPMMMT